LGTVKLQSWGTEERIWQQQQCIWVQLGKCEIERTIQLISSTALPASQHAYEFRVERKLNQQQQQRLSVVWIECAARSPRTPFY